MTSPTSSTSVNASSWRAAWLRFALAVVAFLAGGFVGFRLGEPLGYRLAEAIGRDPAEIKDLLIWCIIATPIVMAALWAWLALVLSGAGRLPRTIALAWLIFVAIGAVVIGIAG